MLQGNISLAWKAAVSDRMQRHSPLFVNGEIAKYEQFF